MNEEQIDKIFDKLEAFWINVIDDFFEPIEKALEGEEYESIN